ncbi:uncharacterized protein LOC114260108 [Camellia sinensis]|uniref:uncharacterized protein LOC114260108 n=1 Tax=Camellia sinensis TaxID=4442 RepID=UPI001035A77D|nr:uncharacterized protein LOC114260108 [Camellia sinensis]
MGDGFPIHRGHVFHTINRLRKLHFNKRALELGSLLSMYGCYQYHNKVGGDRTEDFDVEQGTNSNESNGKKHLESNQEHQVRQTARFWGYIFQIVFQINAGAVMLTDCVFWFIIVLFLAIKDYDLNFLIINMHTINAVFLLGDTALNCLVAISFS